MPKRRNPQQLFPSEEYPSPHLTEESLHEIMEELKPRVPLRPTALRPTLVQEIKNMKYKNFRITLDDMAGRENVSIVEAAGGSGGLRALGIVADTMTIIRADDTFYYILNDPTNDLTPAIQGMSETEFEIEEIYITVPPGATGTAIIRVNYNPYLIRIR